VDQLEKDVVVGAKGSYKVFLLQPERLLDRLAESWKRNTSKLLCKGRVNQPKDVLTALFVNAKEHGLEVALTGVSSASRYASNLSGQGVVQVYSEQVEPLLRGFELRPNDPFPNLELCSPPDPSVFFDLQTDAKGIRWASEVQTYLELASGDTRQKEGAAKLREQILAEVRNLEGSL
jgi:hypothetical protein